MHASNVAAYNYARKARIQASEAFGVMHRQEYRELGTRVLSCAALIAALGVSTTAEARTLEQSVRGALSHHPAIKASVSRKMSARERVKVERGALFPTVNLRGETGLEYTDSNSTRTRRTRGANDSPYATLYRNQGQVIVNQLLFDGFLTQNLVDAARAQADKAGHREVDTRHSIALQAIAAHIDVCRHRQFVRLARYNVAAHRQILVGIRRQVEAGRETTADVSQGRSRLAQAVAVLRARVGELREAEIRYRSIVGRNPPKPIDVPTPSQLRPAVKGMTVDRALAIAQRSNPQLAIAESEVKSRQHRLKATRGLFTPKAEAEASASIGNNLDGLRGRDVQARALLVLTWNVYRGGSDTARRREAIANLAVARFDQADQQRIVRQRVEEAQAALRTGLSRLPVLRSRVGSAQQVVTAYGQQFAAGQRSLLDRLDAQNELFLGRAELISVQYTIVFSYFELLASTGEILTYFDR